MYVCMLCRIDYLHILGWVLLRPYDLRMRPIGGQGHGSSVKVMTARDMLHFAVSIFSISERISVTLCVDE